MAADHQGSEHGLSSTVDEVSQQGSRRSSSRRKSGSKSNDPSSSENRRASVDSALSRINDDDPIHNRFLPFFKKFWPHFDRKKKRRRRLSELETDKSGEDGVKISGSLYGRPVEEVDPFIFEDTFCVISKKFKKHYVYRFSSDNSLLVFGPLNPFRKLAVYIITHRYFDMLIIMTILANCVTLAMATNEFDNAGNKVPPPYDKETDQIEFVFLGVYSAEMILKIIAKGFVLNKYSYLRNTWNVLDFVVVTSGFITIIMTSGNEDENSEEANNLQVLRTFRVLRAVKTISILPGLRMMINALLSSVVQLLEVMALTLFCLMIFALFALEVYMGKLRQKCVLIKDGPLDKGDVPSFDTEHEPIRDQLWHTWVHNPENWAPRDPSFPKEEPMPCGNDSSMRTCPEGFVCLGGMGDNPDDGWTSFDNFFQSMLTTFQLITLDFWERIYDLVLSTSGPWSILFFLMVVFLGSFYLLNLMLAVVAMSYEAEAHSTGQGAMTKHQKLSLHRSASTFSFDDPNKLNLTVMTTYRKRTPSERELVAKALRNSSLAKRKPRRAIRRKTQVVKSKEGDVTGTGTNTGVGTPNVKSATGSVCEEMLGDVSGNGDQDGNGGTRGSIEGSKKTKDKKGKKGNKSKSGKSKKKDRGSVGSGGVRVNALIKSDTEGNRFYLATDPQEFQTLPNDPNAKSSKFGDAILGLLGRRLSLEGEMAKFDPHSEQTHGEFKHRKKSGSDKDDVVIEISMDSPPMIKQPPSSLNSPNDDDSEFEDDSCEGESPSISSRFIEHEKNDTYPVANTRQRRTARHFRQFALLLKTKLKPIVNHCMFEAFITICIVCNTILLAMEHHGQSEEMKNILEGGNNFFMAIFTAECIIKLLALQKEFFAVGWNIFDIFIVGISYMDIIIETFLNLSVIRGMRLLRVFKLAQSWITMKVLLNIIFSTFGALGNLTLVLLIVIYIFAVMGMQVVGGEYTPAAFDAVENKANFPRWSFKNFWYAFMMVFRILCGEWIEPLWECLTAQKATNTEYKCFLIYLPTLIVGNFIVLNLFLALLLNSFNTEELKAQRDKEMEASGKTDNLKKIVGMLMLKKEKNPEDSTTTDGSKETPPTQPSNVGTTVKFMPSVTVTAAGTPPEPASVKPVRKLNLNKPISAIQPPVTITIDGQEAADEAEPVETLSVAKLRFQMVTRKVIMKNRKAIAERMIEQTELKMQKRQGSFRLMGSPQADQKRHSSFGLVHETTPPPSGGSERITQAGDCIPRKCMELNCFCCNKCRALDWTRWDKLRSYAVKIVGHPTFEWLILALIFASSITLCFEDIHLDNNPQLKEALFIMNNVFTAIFIIEMILKWFALGLWGYFTNAWTILDAFIVVVSLVTLYFDILLRLEHPSGGQGGASRSNFAALKALRTLRALRPLRAISRWQGMKIVVNALMYAIPSIFNVLLVCLLFWLVFSIMGVQFFKGKFYKCVDKEGEIVDPSEAATRQECCSKSDSYNYSWINSSPNFDNVLEGYLSLFQIATFEGWMELMSFAVDSVDIDKQPIRDHQMYHYIFFVIFIVFGAFFTLNLFIGVIIDNFNMLKKKYEGNLLEVLLTPSQRHYYTAMKKLGRKKPRKVIKRPTSNLLSPFYDIAMSRRFEIAIFIMIFLNMVVMAFEHYGQRQILVHVLAGFNSFFTTIYALEAIVKIIGLRFFYFTIPWNVFDFVLVLASIVDLMVGDLTVEFPIPPTMLRVVRVFRIGRVLRLVKAAKGIRKLLFALVVSLPALFNIGALLALITFIYSILGMALFGRAPKYGSIDAMLNFDTFMNSMLMLFRLMTAAGWNDVLDALTVVPTVCGSYRKIKCGLDEEPECPNRGLAVAYMVSYIVISYLIVINMYIAIILENFVEANREEEVGIVEDDLEMFYVRWSRYDPQATQFIGFEQLSEFLSSLDPPLGLPKPNVVAVVAFNLPICRGNKIHCLDILHALVKHVLGQIDDSEEFRKLQEQMERKFQKQFPTRKLLDIISSTRIWKIQQNAAVIIQRAWRAYYRRMHPPAEKAKSTQTVKSFANQPAHHGALGGVMNKVGNFLHIGGHGHNNKGGRRESIALQDQGSRISLRTRRAGDRNSDSSQHSSPLTRVDASSGGRGLRARRLSPSRMSGGSFDVAVTYGNQLSVGKNTTNGPSPLPSLPTTPSSLNGETHSVIVQVHQFQ